MDRRIDFGSINYLWGWQSTAHTNMAVHKALAQPGAEDDVVMEAVQEPYPNRANTGMPPFTMEKTCSSRSRKTDPSMRSGRTKRLLANSRRICQRSISTLIGVLVTSTSMEEF